jgi:uncharacterized protein (TIGR00369 family)
MHPDPALEWREIRDDGFNSHIGPIRMARLDEKTWQATLTLDARHINAGGVCHGGVLMSLADVAMGAASYQAGGNRRCATIDFEAHFLAAAKQGQTLMVTAHQNRMVSEISFMECEVSGGERLCLRASGIWKYLGKPVV